MMTDVLRAKEALRERVWRRLIEESAAPPDSHGKIPGFYGNELTAERLAETPEWRAARVVKANPDWAQLPIRSRALEDGKLLYMAVPKMATAEPFYLLDPDALTVPAREAAEKRGTAHHAPHVGTDAMQPIDIVICGSVAVNRSGARIGKGAGYSDLEVALLIEAGLVTTRTLIVAPVHALQVIDEPIPETSHDFRVDLIVTPNDVIHCDAPHRPAGLVWDDLADEQIAAIPVLSHLARRSDGR